MLVKGDAASDFLQYGGSSTETWCQQARQTGSTHAHAWRCVTRKPRLRPAELPPPTDNHFLAAAQLRLDKRRAIVGRLLPQNSTNCAKAACVVLSPTRNDNRARRKASAPPSISIPHRACVRSLASRSPRDHHFRAEFLRLCVGAAPGKLLSGIYLSWKSQIPRIFELEPAWSPGAFVSTTSAWSPSDARRYTADESSGRPCAHDDHAVVRIFCWSIPSLKPQAVRCSLAGSSDCEEQFSPADDHREPLPP